MAAHLMLFALGEDLSPEHEIEFTSDRFVLRDLSLLDGRHALDLGEALHDASWMDAIFSATYRAPLLDEDLSALLRANAVIDDELLAALLNAFLRNHRGERIYGAWI